MTKNQTRAIQLIVSISLLCIIIYKLSFSNFRKLTLNLDVALFIPLIAALLISLFLRSWRFLYLMNLNQTKIKLSHFDSFKIMLTGSALNVVMPSGMGDIAKSYLAYKWSGIKERMLSISIFDKMIAFTSLGLLATISTILTFNFWFLIAILISLVPITSIFLIERYPRNRVIKFMASKLKSINTFDVIRNLSVSPKATLIALVMSVLSWGFSYVVLYYSFLITNIEIPFYWCMAIAPILTIGRIFPFTFNGVGTDEAIFIYLFSTFFKVTHTSSESLLVVALIYRVFIHTLPAALGLISIIITKEIKISQIKEIT